MSEKEITKITSCPKCGVELELCIPTEPGRSIMVKGLKDMKLTKEEKAIREKLGCDDCKWTACTAQKINYQQIIDEKTGLFGQKLDKCKCFER